MANIKRNKALAFGFALSMLASIADTPAGALQSDPLSYSFIEMSKDAIPTHPPVVVFRVVNSGVIPLGLPQTERYAAVDKFHGFMGGAGFEDFIYAQDIARQTRAARKARLAKRAQWLLPLLAGGILTSCLMPVILHFSRRKGKRRRQYYASGAPRTVHARTETREVLAHLHALSECALLTPNTSGALEGRRVIDSPRLRGAAHQIYETVDWLNKAAREGVEVKFANRSSETDFDAFLGWAHAMPRHRAARFGLVSLREAALELELALRISETKPSMVELPLYRLSSASAPRMQIAC